MTRIRTSEDLIAATLDLRRAGELLAHPCDCKDRPGKPHMLGDHLWQSTKDMRPGIRATAPGLAGGNGTGDTEPSAEPTDPHDEFITVISRGQTAARDIIGLVERLRPDRRLEVVPEPSDDDWCTAHFAANYCEPRWRNETTCRWCTEYKLTYRIAPPADIITLREQGKRITVGQITASNKAERKRLNAEKRRKQTA